MAKTGGQTATGSAGTNTAPAAHAEPGVLGRLGSVLFPQRSLVDRPASSANGATGKGQRPTAAPPAGRPAMPMGKMLVFLLVYLIGSIVLQYVLLWASATFGLHLLQPQALFPRTTPFVGSMSTYNLLYLLFIVAFMMVLYRYVLPRNSLRAQTASQRTPSAQSSTPSRNSAARQRARASTTSPTGKATSASGANGARRSAPPSRQTTTAAAAGTDDHSYERVKALQRDRKRKK